VSGSGPRGTASRLVYDGLRAGITHGEYVPGQRLSEVDIAEAFGVSRTPVREALRLLSADGMIDYRPRSVAVVAEWGEEEVTHLTHLRSRLEGYAASVAAERATAEHVARLRELNQQLWDLAAAGVQEDPEVVSALVRVNIEFHELVVTMTGSRILHDHFHRMLHYPLHQRVMRIYGTDGLRTSLQQHDVIVTALEDGDGGWAGALMRAHILSSRSYSLHGRRAGATSTGPADTDAAADPA
jgi:DNA-binding GntR family transcriptional regulator